MSRAGPAALGAWPQRISPGRSLLRCPTHPRAPPPLLPTPPRGTPALQLYHAAPRNGPSQCRVLLPGLDLMEHGLHHLDLQSDGGAGAGGRRQRWHGAEG